MRRPRTFCFCLFIALCCGWLVHSSTALVLAPPHRRHAPQELLFATRRRRSYDETTRRLSSSDASRFVGLLGRRLLDTASTPETAAAAMRSRSHTPQPPKTVALLSSIGFLGHSGLALLSIFLVKAVYALFFRKDAAEQDQQPAGILNRCPWPFIFFHDIKQGLKDSPTWMVVTWVALWRLTKVIKPTA